MNSFPTPTPDCTVLNANRMCMPVNQHRNETNMTRPIFTRFTGTPTARELAAEPPTAKIQLPMWVRSRTQVATAMKRTHQSRVMRMATPPMVNWEANTARAELKPSMLDTSLVATFPVISFVTARLRPRSMKNVPSVTRKLGMPVRTTRKPLMKPTRSATTSETSTPTHMLAVNWKLIIEATRAELTTATPADRSNSPPIMSRATATAGM